MEMQSGLLREHSGESEPVPGQRIRECFSVEPEFALDLSTVFGHQKGRKKAEVPGKGLTENFKGTVCTRAGIHNSV